MYEDYQKQVLTNQRLFIHEVLSDKENATMFRSKIREWKIYYNLVDRRCDEMAQAVATVPKEERIIAEYWFERKNAEREHAERRIKTLEFQLRVCQGKAQWKEIAIDELKLVPIGSFFVTQWEGNSERKKAKCPLHTDKSPSFTWYITNNSWYCFGCGIGGDNINLYMRLNDCDFKTAINALS